MDYARLIASLALAAKTVHPSLELISFEHKPPFTVEVGFFVNPGNLDLRDRLRSALHKEMNAGIKLKLRVWERI